MAGLTELQDPEVEEARTEVTHGRTPESGRGSSRITEREPNRTTENVPRDLNPQEVGEMLEDMRSQIARLEQRGAREREDASTRERRLERDNAILMGALERGIEHREVLDRASERDRAATSRLVGTPAGANRKTVHIGTNLFPDEMRNEGPPPLPEPVPEVHTGRQSEMEETLKAIRDSVACLADRISDTERRGMRNPTRVSFEERGGPFTREVTRSVRPGAAKPLKLSYNGDRDPHLFLDSFKSHTNAKGYSDAVCCNMFQETLAGEALSWFYELPSESIDCFRELADKFVNRFILRTDGQNTAQLFKVKQDRGEGLKAFVNRWQGATARVRSFDKKVAEEAFIQGLLPGKFLYAVKIENPQGYDELMEMAVRHAQADHDTYGGTSAGKKEDRGKDSGSPVQMIREVRAWKGERESYPGPAGKKHKEGSWGKAGTQRNTQGES